MKNPDTLAKLISLFIILYGIGTVFNGIEDYTGSERLLAIAEGGLLIAVSLLLWIRNKASWIACITALLCSFVLYEAHYIGAPQKWYYFMGGGFHLAIVLILFQTNIKTLFSKNNEKIKPAL